MTAGVVASGLAWQASAQAAQAPAPGSSFVEEVVVTAQRREERLQDVGIAVSAYGGDQLRAQGVTSSTEIARLTPGVSLSGAVGGQGLQFSVRGVTQSDFNDAIEAPVAVYVDDTYVSSQQGQGMALYDLERVEVLKGPQGTLFGRNATGGLVHFVTRKPTFDATAGYQNLTYGTFNRTNLEGALNLPLSDRVAIRASGIWNRHDSIWRNRYPAGMAPGAPLNFGPTGVSPRGEDLGAEDALSGRFQVLFQATEHLSIRWTGSAFRQHLSESPFTATPELAIIDDQGRIVGAQYASPTETRAAIGPGGANYFNPAVLPLQGFMFSPNNDGRRAPGATYFGYKPVSIEDREVSKDFALSDLNRFRAYNTALHIDATLGDVSLAAVTSYSRYEKHFLTDADDSPANVFAYGTRSHADSFSQEVRFSGGGEDLTWVGGAYYLDIDAHVAQGLLAPKGSAFALVFGMPDTGVDPLSFGDLTTRSLSGFGQVSWRFAPTWTLVAGGRIIREHQQYGFSSYAMANTDDYAVDLGVRLFPLQPSFADRRTDILWAGKLQLEYRPQDGLLIYAGVNRGVKGGSYNAKLFDGTPPLPPSSIPYRPEDLLSFEGGAKWTPPGGRFILDASVYHYEYKNYQSFIFTDLSGYVQNVDAHTNGVELQGVVRVADGLRLSLSGAYTDATVESLAIAPGVIRDTRTAYTPKYSGALQADYDVPEKVLGGALRFGTVVTYQSSVYHNARNFDGDKIGGRTLVDLNAALNFDRGVRVSAYVKNAFDVRYKVVGLDLAAVCGCNADAYGSPREFGLTAAYTF
jgi:iron complex outermembrane receptor protein